MREQAPQIPQPPSLPAPPPPSATDTATTPGRRELEEENYRLLHLRECKICLDKEVAATYTSTKKQPEQKEKQTTCFSPGFSPLLPGVGGVPAVRPPGHLRLLRRRPRRLPRVQDHHQGHRQGLPSMISPKLVNIVLIVSDRNICILNSVVW